ncbi:MAG: plasmid pRiA4b ORF-3 family protein [Bacteroidota bacterium]|nr:plasmid pRiA4b ORF-3 family protein [Bacteroidota bacterium]
MATVYKFRVILDVEEDVFRDIEISGDDTMESLHRSILDSFSLAPGEMASFYLSDDHWTQGEEIALEDLGTGDVLGTMANSKVADFVPARTKRLLYVYDFFNMWTFFIEMMSERPMEEGESLPSTTLRYGERPDSAPEKDFDGGSGKGLFDDAFGEEDLGDFGEDLEGGEFDDYQ